MISLQVHLDKWKVCTRCSYSETRRKVVLGKGDIPCDILFIGEAPGSSENMLGLPFIGKAGKILDRIIYKTFGSEKTRKYRIAYNNILGCIPLADGSALEGKEEPDDDCIMACRPRVEEFIEIAQPKLIIAVGKLAEEWLDQRYKHCIKIGKIPVATIQHPASILRMPPPAQPLSEHRCGVIITSAVLEHLERR